MEQHEWVQRYINTLPINLRPTTVTDRIKEHLRTAYRNKWTPEDLAKAVAAGNYTTAQNPLGASVYRLSQICEQKPPKNNLPPKVYVAPERSEISPEHTRERFELMRRIMNNEFVSAEDAGQAMADLIERQVKEDN